MNAPSTGPLVGAVDGATLDTGVGAIVTSGAAVGGAGVAPAELAGVGVVLPQAATRSARARTACCRTRRGYAVCHPSVTVSVPFIPSWSCPTRRQTKVYVPASSETVTAWVVPREKDAIFASD
jgi:hypothetical protein